MRHRGNPIGSSNLPLSANMFLIMHYFLFGANVIMAQRTGLYILIVFLLVHSVASVAQEGKIISSVTIQSAKDYANTRWEGLNIPAGTRLNMIMSPSGKVLRQLEFAGGVTISELEKGGTLEIDHSKGGGIMCGWGLSRHLKLFMDECHRDEIEVREKLDIAVSRYKDFIVANSLRPVTQAALEDEFQKNISDGLQRSGKTMPDICKGDFDKFARQILSQKSYWLEHIDKSLDESLATPRPPVNNPCM